MASTGLQSVATLSVASLQHPAFLADRGASSSSRSGFFYGRQVPLRLAFLPLSGGCKGWRKRRPPSGSGGNCMVVHASTAIVGPVSGEEKSKTVKKGEEKSKVADVELLACPVCYKALSRNGIPGLNQRAISRSGFRCLTCKKAYSSRNTYLDLTVTANAKVYSESQATGTELFRNPLVSFAYERGWRQNFERAGFPGPDEEVKMALKFLKSKYGGVLLDVSCGSGLFTRRFASLSLFSAIISIDYSENMLRQAFEYIKQDEGLLDKTIALVRADVARMPFATGSVDAVFAGAALHCWPSPAAGVSEISRILRPGGVFVATTFLSVPAPFDFQVAKQIRKALFPDRQTSLRYWQAAELEDLMKVVGLVNYQKITRGGFIMITGQKPE